jgi:hypothetical protein
MVDLDKYKKKRFNKNSFIDRRIKALFLFYDKKVEDLKLSYKESISLLNHMIRVLVDSEEYELAAAFRARKFKKYKKWRKVKRLWSVKLFYRVWRFRLSKLIRKVFK